MACKTWESGQLQACQRNSTQATCALSSEVQLRSAKEECMACTALTASSSRARAFMPSRVCLLLVSGGAQQQRATSASRPVANATQAVRLHGMVFCSIS
mmetsp:Transcript_72056/g.134709  ORF Transcript_72056/g.134709 Transcript_72056/m.134709 type:complete len:99 (-) Transcript_72056:128-424(-)